MVLVAIERLFEAAGRPTTLADSVVALRVYPSAAQNARRRRRWGYDTHDLLIGACDLLNVVSLRRDVVRGRACTAVCVILLADFG